MQNKVPQPNIFPIAEHKNQTGLDAYYRGDEK